jgi:wobble nucleotide-excising tRNase
MPQLTRVNRITHRMFHAFLWASDVLDFGRFNLIYGWNASGKTTLSSLFRKLELREPLTEGTADFVIDGSVCDLTKISAESLLPQVRVFNREFVEANVLSSQLAPIFYLGAESVEKQRQIELLKKELENMGIPVKVNAESGGKANGIPERR